ncbi:MAG: dihydrolipoyllysine-residue acetyltransferase [Methylococcaceae bacterium]|nr:dihydrolipoyllysine-residue acetyltransferase [Methylococcaceae bacterium]
MEVPSPRGGTVKSVAIKPGDRVSRGALILVLESESALSASVSVPEQSPVQTAPLASAPENPPEAPLVAPVSQVPTEQEVCVPDIGDYKDIEVIEVLVKVGDALNADDSLITLESDKAAMEVPAPLGGVVKAVKVRAGDRVSKGTPIVLLEVAGAPSNAPTLMSSSKNDTQPAPQSMPAVAEAAAISPVRREPILAEGQAMPPHASPAIRKFARELGVSLARVKGTGPKGRISREDVQQFVKQSLQREEQSPSTSVGGFAWPAAAEVDFSRFGPVESLALSRIQKLSGPNLHRNWVSIPHITQFDEADITDLEAFRVSLKAEGERRGIKLSFLPFVMKAVAASLKAFPSFNASLAPGGDTLILKKYFHIGVAVDTPEGLVVPVIRDVDQKSVFELGAELVDVSQRARNKKLRGADLEGGCFTISSLGGIGGTAFTPIINAPEVAILGLSRSQMKPVYLNGQFVPRLMLPLSLSYDHRVIDGAQGARFIVHLGGTLADLRRVLL